MSRRLLIACAVLAMIQGCTCTAHVRLDNQSEIRMLADVSTPWPGYGMFRQHCQYSVLMEPQQTWDSQATSRRDRVQLPTVQHEPLLVRLINLDRQGWPNVVYCIDVADAAHVTISGAWDALQLRALDREGESLEVWLQDDDHPLFRGSSPRSEGGRHGAVR